MYGLTFANVKIQQLFLSLLTRLNPAEGDACLSALVLAAGAQRLLSGNQIILDLECPFGVFL